MYLFIKSMAFFWTLAEAIILVCVRWGHLLAAGEERPQRRAFVVTGAGLVLSFVLLFLGEPLLGRFVDLDVRLSLTLYRWALWNFFCTVWVVLEGCIMVYVCRIFRTLKAVEERSKTGSATGGPSTKSLTTGIPILVGAFLFVYTAYQAGLFCAVDRFGLDAGPVARISLFYIRICGVFWILFEWVVAVKGIRAYRILKQRNWS